MKKREEKELKLYEKLGIKKFQKIGFFRRNFITCGIIYPFTKLMSRKERYKCVDGLFYKQKSNYNLGEIKGLSDLERYKKYPVVNSVRYLIDLATCIPIIIKIIDGRSPLLSTISTTSAVVVNMYCIMLQRYNYIRLNRVIEKAKNRSVQEEKEESKLEKKESTSVKEVIKNSTVEQLKRYREYLTEYQIEHGITTKEVPQNSESNLVRVRVDTKNKGRTR